MVIDTLQHGDGTGPGQHPGDGEFPRTAGRGQHTAVQVKTHHLGHHLGCGPIERQIDTGEIPGQFRQPAVGAQEGVRAETGGEHALGDQHALGDNKSTPGRQVRPAVDAVEVTKVVNPLITGVGDVDDRHHGR